QPLVLLEHAIVATVRAEEYVAGERPQDLERLGEVVGDLGVGLVVDQLEAGVDVWAADDDHVERLGPLQDTPGPGSAPSGVAGCAPGSQLRATEFDDVPILENPVDLAGLPPAGGVEVLARAPRGDHLVVATHDTDLRASELLQQGMARHVV